MSVPSKIVVATRKSPLALAQTELVMAFLRDALPSVVVEKQAMVTTGDQKLEWSLEKRGGKGLFTKELELALLEKRADVAMHSAKDLPTEMDERLAIAGFLPREVAHDVFVRKAECEQIATIATGSPRRRAQASLSYPNVSWSEIRGNVQTRMEKILGGAADATILAGAGLKRLGISGWDGLCFEPIPLEEMVPAVGQGAIAVQCHRDDLEFYEPLFDKTTAFAVRLERCFLELLGGGCHSAYAAHFDGEELLVFHENFGFQRWALRSTNLEACCLELERRIRDLGLES